MGAKISTEMRRAVQLVHGGIRVKEAAKSAGVSFRALYRIICDKRNVKRYLSP